MTTVWLARHGEVHNPAGILYGRQPRMRLTPEGLRQAQAIGQFLAVRKLVAIYSSPMLRARRTAEAVLSSQPTLLRVRIDSDLQEIRTGWQGEPLEALERIKWDFYTNPRRPDDETLQVVHDRMLRWLHRVARRHPDAEVLGVSHGDPILILVGTLRGLPLDSQQLFPRPYPGTGSLYRISLDARGVCQDVQFVPPPLVPSVSKVEAADSKDEAAA